MGASLKQAIALLGEMGRTANVVSFNVAMTGCAKAGRSGAALALLARLKAG